MRPRTTSVLAGTLLAAALASACSPATKTPTETYRGTIRSGCAPHDAPSIAIELKDSGGSSLVSFNLWPPRGAVPPTTIEFDAGHPDGLGTFCTGPDSCETAVWGKLVLESPPGEASVSGTWTMGMQDGRVYHGTFAADWLAIQVLCG